MKHYIVVSAPNDNDLVDEVNKQIENGYAPYGPLVITVIQESLTEWFYQPMMRKEGRQG